jgi:hypothetical protein
MSSLSIFFNDPKYITGINHNIATTRRVENEIAHRAFPATVEIDTNEIAFAVNNRGAGISTSGMI